MRKLGLFIVFLLVTVAFIYLNFNPLKYNNPEASYYYEDEFDRLNDEFWFVGEWRTTFPAYEKVFIKNGILNIPVNATDRGPFLISKGIPVEKGDIVTVKRRAKLHYANENFTGGLALVQTDNPEIELLSNKGGWSKSIGDALVLVEYVHNYDENSKRPGRDIFRVLPPGWENSNYALFEPKFDEWFEEKIVYDTRNLKITYTLNGNSQKVNGLLLDKPYVKVFMHSYGRYTGHYGKVDDFSIEVKKGK